MIGGCPSRRYRSRRGSPRCAASRPTGRGPRRAPATSSWSTSTRYDGAGPLPPLAHGVAGRRRRAHRATEPERHPAAPVCDLVLQAGDPGSTRWPRRWRSTRSRPAAFAVAAARRRRRARSTTGLLAESAVYSALQAGPEFAAWRAGRPADGPGREEGPPVTLRRDGDELHVILAPPRRCATPRPGHAGRAGRGVRARPGRSLDRPRPPRGRGAVVLRRRRPRRVRVVPRPGHRPPRPAAAERRAAPSPRWPSG